MTHLLGIVVYVLVAVALVVLVAVTLGNAALNVILAVALLLVIVALLALRPRRPRHVPRYSRTDDAIWNDTRWQVMPEQHGEWTAIDEGETALVVREP